MESDDPSLDTPLTHVGIEMQESAVSANSIEAIVMNEGAPEHSPESIATVTSSFGNGSVKFGKDSVPETLSIDDYASHLQVVITTSPDSSLQHLLSRLLLACVQPTDTPVAGGVASGASATLQQWPQLWETPFINEFIGQDKLLDTWTLVHERAGDWQSELSAAVDLLRLAGKFYGVSFQHKCDTFVLLACFMRLTW